MNGVSARAHRMPALMGQALEDIVVRGTDIYAFAPMEDRDRAQVRIITYDFCYSESSLVLCFSSPIVSMVDMDYLSSNSCMSCFFYTVKNISFSVSDYEQIHKMAAIYRLKSGSQGSGKKRY